MSSVYMSIDRVSQKQVCEHCQAWNSLCMTYAIVEVLTSQIKLHSTAQLQSRHFFWLIKCRIFDCTILSWDEKRNFNSQSETRAEHRLSLYHSINAYTQNVRRKTRPTSRLRSIQRATVFSWNLWTHRKNPLQRSTRRLSHRNHAISHTHSSSKADTRTTIALGYKNVASPILKPSCLKVTLDNQQFVHLTMEDTEPSLSALRHFTSPKTPPILRESQNDALCPWRHALFRAEGHLRNVYIPDISKIPPRVARHFFDSDLP